MEYKEFRVIVKDRGERQIIKPSGLLVEGRVQVDPLKVETIKMFNRWLAGGAVKQYDDLAIIGSHLFELLFAGMDKDGKKELGSIFKEEFDKVRDESSEPLRLVLEFEPEARELGEMPWEYIYYPGIGGDPFFIGGHTRLVLARHIPLDEIIVKPTGKPLHILVVVSRPTDRRTVKAEPVIDALKKLKGAVVEELPQPTRRSLREMMSKKPHVLHFIGHGEYTQDGGYLDLVKGEQEIADPTIDRDIVNCFMDHQPRLIFLQACEGARSESYQAFKGVGLSLIRGRIPAVVAMQYEVANIEAITFAQKFYESLSEGKPIDVAVQAGRIELGMYLNESGFSSRAFGSPVVYLRRSAQGMVLVDDQARDEEPPKQPKNVSTEKVPCPYPDHRDKDAWVLPAAHYCVGCQRPLKQCPNCGGVVAARINFCANCGPLDSVEADAPQKEKESEVSTSSQASQQNAVPVSGSLSWNREQG